jgi:hypothetical protein
MAEDIKNGGIRPDLVNDAFESGAFRNEESEHEWVEKTENSPQNLNLNRRHEDNRTLHSSQTLQAQAEHFADQGVKQFSKDQGLLLKYSAQLATVTNLNKIPEDFPDELKELIARNKDAYILFLRGHRREERTALEENAKLYGEKFANPVAELKKKIALAEKPNQVEGYLGSGSNGDAYKIEVDGKTLVAKFSSSASQNNFEMAPLLRSKGLPHTAQLVAFSLADGVKIMELLPGQDISKFTPETAPEYPEEQIVQLIETILNLEKNGITIDPKASNFFYDKEKGFSILDFHLSNGNGFCAPEQQVMSLRHALTARKYPEIDWSDADRTELEKQSLDQSRTQLKFLAQFLDILQKRYPALLKKWQETNARYAADPNMRVSPLVDREAVNGQDPEIAQHLLQLTQMGF